jgi:acyl-CoA thioester hydrolase
MAEPTERGPDVARPPIPQRADFFFWTEEKLRNIDTDQFRHINNAVMASFFEAGRMEMFHTLMAEAPDDEAGLVVVRLLMNFHKELHYPGTVEIGTAVTRVGKSSFDAAQGLFHDQDCIATASATCVFIHRETRRPYVVSGAWRRRMLAQSQKAL